LLFALFKLLFDNILYAAIMLRLHASFGIEERDVIAVVAANLIPILATVVTLSVIYWLTLHHHAVKAADAQHAVIQETTPAEKSNVLQSGKSTGVFLLRKLEPLPAITLGLAIAVVVVAFYQNWADHRAPQNTLTPAEISVARNVMKQIVSSLGYVKDELDDAHKTLDTWHYEIQVNGPDKFLDHIGTIYNNMTFAGFTGMSNSIFGLDQKKYPDIAQIAKNNSPDCSAKTLAFYNEVKRIKEHPGADMIFILINDTKMAEWRAALPECDKWIVVRMSEATKVQEKYDQAGQ
jgi:hypothetical protein